MLHEIPKFMSYDDDDVAPLATLTPGTNLDSEECGSFYNRSKLTTCGLTLLGSSLRVVIFIAKVLFFI